ncbi:MAG: PAS domain S-box protein [Methanomicrobiales archaeon]
MAAPFRVLYVDDEPDLLDICKLFLEDTGDFSVATIDSAHAALDLLGQEQFDVIISDYQMPMMDGIQFLIEVRRKFGDLPFILFTGKGREEVVIQAINSGADFYVQKGGDPSAQFAELSNKIGYAVMRMRAEKALSESQKRTAEIIDFLPDATFAISTDGVVIAWNRAMEVMTGVVKDDILNKGNYEYSLPFYRERRPILIDFVLNPRETTSEKYPFIRKEGDRVISEISMPHFHEGRGAYLWFTASLLYDSQGNISGAIESIRDITDLKRAEVDLRESEERYRHVVEDQTEFICRFLPDRTYIFVNEAYCRYFGMSREEIIGTRFQPDIHPEERELVKRLIESLTPEHPLGTIDQRTIMPDGSTRWQRWVDRAIFHADGSLKEYQSVGRDITETKQDEVALRESEERFRTLLERVPSVAVQGYHPDHTVVYWNEANTHMYGYTAEEALGRDIRELLVPVPARDEVTIAIARMAETGIPEPAGELELLHKDGSLVPVFSSHAVVKIPGRRTIQFCLDVDLSARKKAETALRESEELFRCLFDSANEAIFLHEILPDGKPGMYTKVNTIACQRLGYSPDELLGMSPRDIVSSGHRLNMPKIARMIQKEGYGTFEAIHQRKDGSEFPVEISTRILELHGTKMGLSIANDITERKRAEKSLQQANRKLNLLASITRHDILNQLTVLIGQLELLERKQPDPSFTSYFNKISRAADRINAMIRFTKEYEEIGVHTPAWQDCRTLVDTVAKEIQLGKVMVKNDIPAGSEVYADPLVTKVFHNLIDNAVRYGEKITTLHFSVLKYGDDRLILCEDDGEGVPAEEKRKIFDTGLGRTLVWACSSRRKFSILLV